jgi:type IV pilus assembly protein PilF
VRRGVCKSVVALALGSALLLTGCVSSPSDKIAATAGAPIARLPLRADAQTRATIRLQLAISYFEQRQFAIVLDELTLALQSVPDFADAYSMRALAYMEMGQEQQAEKDFLQAIRLAPGNPDFANNYGWFLCNSDRPGEAIPYFEAAIANRAYQSPGKALTNAGACSLKRQDVQAAERYLTRAFQYDPTGLATNLNLSRLYAKQREFERARFHISLAANNHVLNAQALWLAIRIERKLGNQSAENDLTAQLRRRYPSSSEYAAYQRGAFDE